MNRYTPNNFGFLIPDQDGAWIHHIEVAALERKIAELEATAVINTRYCAEVIERCAKICDEKESLLKSKDLIGAASHVHSVGVSIRGLLHIKKDAS